MDKIEEGTSRLKEMSYVYSLRPNDFSQPYDIRLILRVPFCALARSKGIVGRSGLEQSGILHSQSPNDGIMKNKCCNIPFQTKHIS